ncbi:hypothetical protein SAMD00019534_118910 [Acytostelium subglobosum LB1]|uniref:hypothetical protein n=1 Tax=Acytostelium subglobosum LB1 TaxID=1410327 RepID=UPI0006447B0C|nr:hypothetical protein SAMD00019534_118910 [Acytostelium subglobosum LB1]GAM28715.1 hypothetical protein SAMD00019534_118910 [Acytostelium subglobosum LB1]|eukprot:XP_012748270.1 hypothetical protein SAMD00019534_118910 [Acytostelium subglobosum LB1]
MYRYIYYITTLLLIITILSKQVTSDNVNCIWQANGNCVNAAYPCSLTDPSNWVGGVAPVPGSSDNYTLDIDATISSPQYIMMNQTFGAQQIQLLNITGGAQFVIKGIADIETINQTIVVNSQINVYSNASFGDVSLTNSTLSVVQESVTLNGYIAFDINSHVLAQNNAQVTVNGPGNVLCQLQFNDQSTLVLQNGNDLVYLKGGLLSTNMVVVTENTTIILEGVSTLSNLNGQSGVIRLNPGSDLIVNGPSVQVASSILLSPGSNLLLNGTNTANIATLTLSDETSSATLISVQVSVGSLYSDGGLTVQSSNFVTTQPSTVAQITLLSGTTLQSMANITIQDLIINGSNVELIFGGGSAFVGQKTQQHTGPSADFDITVAKAAQFTSTTNLNVSNGEIIVYGYVVFEKSVTASNVTLQDTESSVTATTSEINASVIIIAGQLYYSPNQPLSISGSLSIHTGEFVTAQTINVGGSLNLGIMTLQIIGSGKVQVQSNLLLSPDTNIIYETTIQPGVGNGAPIEVQGTVQLAGNINVVFTPSDYSAKYVIVQSQSQITGSFAKLMVPDASYQSRVSITNGQPPNYVLVTFKQPSQQMAGWKIGLIVIGIMFGILLAGFGFLYYKRHDGYLRLNN